MKHFTFALIATVLTQGTFAHEGHDKTPGAVSAPHGGIVQAAGHLHLELVTSRDGVKLYTFDNNMKAVPTSEVKIEGTVTLPKKSKGDPLSFEVQADYISAIVESRGAYRYTLNLTVTYQGKKERAKFSVEPQ